MTECYVVHALWNSEENPGSVINNAKKRKKKNKQKASNEPLFKRQRCCFSSVAFQTSVAPKFHFIGNPFSTWSPVSFQTNGSYSFSK